MKLEFATLNSGKTLTTSANPGSGSSTNRCPNGWTEIGQTPILGLPICKKDKRN